eukprot:657369-Pyramimonas_sp.AAC.1
MRERPYVDTVRVGGCNWAWLIIMWARASLLAEEPGFDPSVPDTWTKVRVFTRQRSTPGRGCAFPLVGARHLDEGA